MRYVKLLIILICIATSAGCVEEKTEMAKKTFGQDLSFLKKHTEVVIIEDESGNSQVAVLPTLQGRVMTSTAEGLDGLSFGWINRELIASGKVAEHINVYGGEDRFWIGPEGGQFSIFFKNNVPFDLEHWFTPASIDTEPFELESKSKNSVLLQKDIQLENYSGTIFNLLVDREIRVLERSEALEALEIMPAKTVKMVAFESNNKMTNTGTNAWEKETGLLSIWILGMFNPSPTTTIVVPFNAGSKEELGPTVNDAYFGKVPANRLVVKEGVMFFSGDGQYRSKIGLSPQRAKPILGSYDIVNKVLTIVQYNKPEVAADYVNSMWELQDEPYKGDVVNSYNDGPSEPGAKPLGPFYELETSSPAAALRPGQTISHIHRTYHLQGSEAELNSIAKATLGVTIAEIKSAIPK
ncbi:MAG: hypothetical protein H8D56_12215 [Planctomycetes bacterium]|nr:hypothetical protein [Planctomycetota bacterium]MBL7143480.1 hypothetical protein [Phycisphaerae bacterium]